MKAPDYSPFAKQYAQSRPLYPEELFKYLASLTQRHEVVWDCAAGSGQAASSLTSYFDRIIATDISQSQLKNAFRHKRIQYIVSRAETPGIKNNSVDLITVASAVHWFNLTVFFNEVGHIIKPGGVLAVWTYHVGYVEPPFDNLFRRFYRDIVSPYFAEGARLVDNRYNDIKLPGTPISPEEFYVRADWNLNNMLGFIQSWSGTQQYIKEKGRNPVDLIMDDLRELWGDPDKIHSILWPLYIRISRLL